MENENIDENILASVSYTIYKDDEDVIIDASMGDYNAESSEAMAKIIEVISKDSSIVHTINMIRDGLVNAGHEDLLIDLLTRIGNIIMKHGDKIENSGDDKPCISPLDMM
mgnify:CR=1 FL=1